MKSRLMYSKIKTFKTFKSQEESMNACEKIQFLFRKEKRIKVKVKNNKSQCIFFVKNEPNEMKSLNVKNDSI